MKTPRGWGLELRTGSHRLRSLMQNTRVCVLFETKYQLIFAATLNHINVELVLRDIKPTCQRKVLVGIPRTPKNTLCMKGDLMHRGDLEPLES